MATIDDAQQLLLSANHIGFATSPSIRDTMNNAHSELMRNVGINTHLKRGYINNTIGVHNHNQSHNKNHNKNGDDYNDNVYASTHSDKQQIAIENMLRRNNICGVQPATTTNNIDAVKRQIHESMMKRT